jgi:ferredoxin-NADP reductase
VAAVERPRALLDQFRRQAARQLTPGTTFWSFAGNVVQTVFDAGTLLHKKRATDVAFDEAAEMYRSTVTAAFQNVADSLHAVSSDAKTLKATYAAGRAAFKSLEIARMQLRLGAIGYLGLLTAETRYDTALLVLEPANGEPLTAALAGQFIVLRLRPSPDESALLRSYSLSGAPSEDRYRISIKREPHGAAGAYIDTRVQAGDTLDVSAPRGSFTLRQGERPVVLVSAGIGATPVLAMLYALAAEQSRRGIWWIHGARNSSEHPFAAEARELLKTLPGSRSQICYSAPKPTDRPTVDFDKVGRLGVPMFEEMGVPPDADFYICGPAAFMSGLVEGLAGWGSPVTACTPRISGRARQRRRASPRSRGARRIRRRKPRRSGRWYPLRAAISLSTGVPHSTACSNWPKRAMCRCACRAAPEFVITAIRG